MLENGVKKLKLIHNPLAALAYFDAPPTASTAARGWIGAVRSRLETKTTRGL